MLRSWPNIEAELLEVELDLQFDAPAPEDPPAPFRLKPIHLMALLPAFAIGLALVPQVDDEHLVLVPVETLPEPAVATTAAVLPVESQAHLTSQKFDLTRIQQVGAVAGPAFFNERVWLIASGQEAGSGPTVYSSDDNGSTWTETGLIATGAKTVRIHDLGSFGGSLVALGTISHQSGPASTFGYPDAIVIWLSRDGSRWTEDVVVGNDDRHWHPLLDLHTDGRTILISGRPTTASGGLIEAVIPEHLLPAVAEGKLDVTVTGSGRVSLIAPPGIELFRSSEAVALADDVRNILYRSDDLQVWEEVAIKENLILFEMVLKPGGGFVASTGNGDIYSAIDGRGWGRNLTIPPANYSRWGEWLVGVQSSDGLDRLVIGAGTNYSTVEHPLDAPVIWEVGGVSGGSAGLLSVVPTYVGRTPAISLSGFQVRTLVDGTFSISAQGSSEAARILYQPDGSYDPVSDMVSIDLGDGEQVFFDLDDLQPLREGIHGRWKTDLFWSTDATKWSESSTSFPTADVEVLGDLPDGFLIAVGNYIGPYAGGRSIELYRMVPPEMTK